MRDDDPLAELQRETSTHEYALNQRHIFAIARANREQWVSLLRVADAQHWSPEITELAVDNLSDDRLSVEHKLKLLSGEIVPVLVRSDGDFEIPPEMLGRALREDRDPVLGLEALLDTIDVVRAWLPRDSIDEIVARASAKDRQRLEDSLPGTILFLTELMRGVRLKKDQS